MPITVEMLTLVISTYWAWIHNSNGGKHVSNAVSISLKSEIKDFFKLYFPFYDIHPQI